MALIFDYVNSRFDIDKRFCVYCAIVKQGDSHYTPLWGIRLIQIE